MELRSLAARVAAETGSRALPADADALARRLQLVTGAVQALADLGEARQVARAKAQHAKDKLCDMRQVSDDTDSLSLIKVYNYCFSSLYL